MFSPDDLEEGAWSSVAEREPNTNINIKTKTQTNQCSEP